MSDTRKHRGAHPSDGELFAAAHLPDLRSAMADLSRLLTRGYASLSALKLVGDRYQLTVRQRTAVARTACSDEALAGRLARRVAVGEAAGGAVAIDGYNLLITIESALAGGVILAGRDGACRDLASMHGSYRTMTETRPALELIGQSLAELGVAAARWLLDSPVSNSGRLRSLMLALAQRHGWEWSVQLVRNPDADLMQSPLAVASSDSVVLDGCMKWINLARHVVDTRVPQAWVLELG